MVGGFLFGIEFSECVCVCARAYSMIHTPWQLIDASIFIKINSLSLESCGRRIASVENARTKKPKKKKKTKSSHKLKERKEQTPYAYRGRSQALHRILGVRLRAQSSTLRNVTMAMAIHISTRFHCWWIFWYDYHTMRVWTFILNDSFYLAQQQPGLCSATFIAIYSEYIIALTSN